MARLSYERQRDILAGRWRWEDDFLGDQLDDRWLTVGTGGRGSEAIQNALNGVLRQTTGTTLNDKRNLVLGQAAALLQVDASKDIVFEVKYTRVTTTNYAAYFGIFDNDGITGSALNLISISQVAGGNFIAYTRLAGVLTTVNLGVAPSAAGTFDTLRFEKTSGNVDFYVNDVYCGSSVTNIPAVACLLLLQIGNITIAAATSQDIDYVWVDQDRV